MKTACTPDCLFMVGTSLKGRAPKRLANASARARSQSQTATKSDSGNAQSAVAWIWPTLPQPISAVRTAFIASPGKIPGGHSPEESQRLGHLVHAVHAVFDADPALIVMLGKDAK